MNDNGDSNKYAVFLHLLTHPKCLMINFMFSVACRARSAAKLKVLEVVCICFYKPDLCKQKKHANALRLFSYVRGTRSSVLGLPGVSGRREFPSGTDRIIYFIFSLSVSLHSLLFTLRLLSYPFYSQL